MNDSKTTLLVAERDEPTRAFLVDNLAADGYEPLGAQTEAETRVKLAAQGPELLIPGSLADGVRPLPLVRAIRAGEVGADPTLPVIMVGDRGGELELVRALEAGCDHFMARPFSYPELLACVRACMRRAFAWRVPRRLVIGSLIVDRDERRALHAGAEIPLSRLEFDLLAHLAGAPTRVFSKWELLRDVWGFRSRGSSRTVDAHAVRLRRKLALAGAPHLLHTVRGVGYRLSLAPVLAEQEPVTLASNNGHAA
jgi:DNA-binding response OmpR family regulator